jgi:glycosyltransferase involved in cell wall biosynthesis
VRILQVVGFPRLTRGAALQGWWLAHDLRARGHEVEIVICSDAAQEDGVPVHTHSMTGLRDLTRLRRLLGEGGFDVVHTHYRDVGLRRVLAASIGMRRAPLVVAHWGNVYRVDRRRRLPDGWRQVGGDVSFSAWTGTVLRSPRVGRVVAISAAARDVLVRGAGVDPQKIAVIHQGVDPERFHPSVDGSGVRRELGIPLDVPVVGMLSAYRWVRDFPSFLDAAEVLARERTEVRFLLAGERTELATRELAGRDALSGRVTFAGVRSDVPEVLAAMDVVVNCALLEGLSGAIREALALAKPVVASDVGGNPEIVIDGDTGLLVRPRAPAELAAAVAALLDDPERAARLGARGRQLVLDRHTRAGRAERVEALYVEALAERR